jgi:hypothetical protein
MRDPGGNKWAGAFRSLIWSAVTVAFVALTYAIVINWDFVRAAVDVAPFAIGCLLESIKGRNCAP